MLINILVIVLSRRIWTWTPVSIASLRNAPPTSGVAISLPSDAVIDRTVKTEEVDTVGAARSS